MLRMTKYAQDQARRTKRVALFCALAFTALLCACARADAPAVDDAPEAAVVDIHTVIDVIFEDKPVIEPTPLTHDMPSRLPMTNGEAGAEEGITPDAHMAAVIFVDNRPVVALESKLAARQALEEFAVQYGEAHLGGQVKSADFVEKVDVFEQSDAEILYDSIDAMFMLAKGGDDGKALLHIKTVETVKIVEPVPFQTESVNDADMYVGSSKTLREGKAGKAESVYDVVMVNGVEKSRERVSSVVLEKPVNKMVAKGTKPAPSSKPGPNEGAAGPSAGSLKFAYPISGRTSSYFGIRNGKMHYGLDILQTTGTEIKASESGTVSIAETRGDYGLLVEINHGSGFATRYAHCSKLLVTKGQRVSKGDTVALVGSTGNSSAPHVHFEIRVNGTAYNPLQYLPK